MDRDRATPSVEDLPGPAAEDWIAYHHEHAAPSTHVFGFVWDHSAPASGPFCTDVDGNVLLDFTSHVAAAPLGYNNPDLLDKMAAFDLVDPLKIAGQDFYVSDGNAPGEAALPGPAQLMDRLTDATSHYGLDTVFLSNSGAEAVENAVKIAYAHEGGKWGFTFEGAFHGRTLGTLSLNRSKAVHRRGFPEIASVHDVPFCRDGDCDPERCSCGFFHPDRDGQGATSRLREKLHPTRGNVDPEAVSYLILEPIQGEGGFHVPSEAFAREVADLVEAYDLTLVADEVQSGVGRTGRFWAADHYPIEPDVIAAAKGLRVGATIGGETFPDEPGRLSSTWGAGDVLSSATGAFTIEVIEEAGLMDNATERGRQFRERLAAADPDGVTDVRGKGLMLGVEFESRDRREAVHDAAFQRGLLLLTAGHRTIRVLPPLDVREREIEMGVDLLVEAIEATA